MTCTGCPTPTICTPWYCRSEHADMTRACSQSCTFTDDYTDEIASHP